MGIPDNDEILALLDQLKHSTADELESLWLEFKPWNGAKEDMKVATEYAVCLANSEGGVVVFGVADKTTGRSRAIHGAEGYDLDVWRRGLYSTVTPSLPIRVEALDVPEGTGKLLVVRVPKGSTVHGTTQGLFKRRVGNNCMPLDPQGFQQAQVSSGRLDWSGQPTGWTIAELDLVELARARNILRRIKPESELLQLADPAFATALGGMRAGRVTHAGLLLFGREEIIRETCPQHQVHYVLQASDVAVTRNDSYRHGLLRILEQVEQNFTGPANPEQEVSMGLFKLRVPAFPMEVVREAVLNAVTHRDYLDPGEVLVRHAPRELVVTSPGGFIGGITPMTILRAESISRNRTLAEVFEKLGLVERAGIGRRRIFRSVLALGKRAPVYESDGTHVTLRIFDGAFDERLAMHVARWQQQGVEVELNGLLLLSFFRDHTFIDTKQAAQLLQLPMPETRTELDRWTLSSNPVLERRGRAKSGTYHLAKALASDLHGKVVYSRGKGIDSIRYAEMVKQFIADHGAITPQQCRELLGLGESPSAKVEISRLLKKWSSPCGFLRSQGNTRSIRYSRSDG